MVKLSDILVLIGFIGIIVLVFPNEAIKIINNRFYMLIGGIIVLLILFMFWLKIKNK